MQTGSNTLSPALAGAFNVRFHDRPRLVQDSALELLRVVALRLTERGEKIEPGFLLDAVELAVEKKPQNPIAYVHATARLRALKAAEDESLEREAEQKREALKPIGGPAVKVMGATLPAGELPEHWKRETEAAIRGRGLSAAKAKQVRTVMLMLSRGWRDTPTAAIRSIAQGLAEGQVNPFEYAVRELEALEQQGVACVAPERDPFIREVEDFMGARRDANAKMRAQYLDAVHLLLDAPWTVGEHRIDLRQMGPAIVTSTWGSWVQKVIDSVTKKEAIPNPYRYLLRKATRLYLEQHGVPESEDKEEHPAYH